MKEQNLDTEIQDVMSEVFMTPFKFSMEVERIHSESNGDVSYIDAVVICCDKHDIEYEMAPKLLMRSLKDKIKYDAVRLQFIKGKVPPQLP